MRAGVDCGGMDQGDLREETVVKKCLWRKARQHGSRVILLSHA